MGKKSRGRGKARQGARSAPPGPLPAPTEPARSNWLPELSRRQWIAACAAVLLVGLLLRILNLTQKEIWLDEANAILMAKQPLAELFELLRMDSSPPLYYVVLHYWLLLFGSGEAAVRALSVIGDMALIASLLWVGLRLFNARVALVAALFCALSSGAIDYAQQARQYTWLATFALISTYFLITALESPTWKRTIRYALALLAAIYLHNYALMLLPAHFAIWLLAAGWRIHPLKTAGAAAILVVGYLPWLPSFLTQLGRSDYLWWMERNWHVAGGAFGAAKVTAASFIRGFPVTHEIAAASWVWLLMAAVAVTFALFGKRRNSRYLALYLVVPIAVGLVASLLAKYPSYIPGRVDRLVFPGFCLLAALAVDRLPRPAFSWVAILALVGVSVPGTVRLHSSAFDQGARESAAELATHVREGDVVVAVHPFTAALRYYMERRGLPVRVRSFPADHDRHLGNFDRPWAINNPTEMSREGSDYVDELEASLVPGRRIFFTCPRRSYALCWPLRRAFADTRSFSSREALGPFTQQRFFLPYFFDVFERMPESAP